jgi:DNA-binding transcriptional MerR regulator
MLYTIGEMSKKLGIPASTLRYYEKEQLLPCVERTTGGIRMFKESDLEFLNIINCLKKAGVSISGIREFIALVKQGDASIDARLAFFQREKECVLRQIGELKKTLEVLEFKCWYYTQAKQEGTTKRLAGLDPEEFPKPYRKIKFELTQDGK